MKAKDFLRYLVLMDKGYKYTRDDSPMFKWFLSRTDDILTINTKDELDIICLGTQPKVKEWFYNVFFLSVEFLNMGRVHGGFAKNVDEMLGSQANPDSLISLCLKAEDEGKIINVVGHSRGYPIAVLLSAYLVHHGVNADRMLVVGCGGAKVGNKRFNGEYKRILGDRTFVLNGKYDPVPTQPFWGYTNGQVTKIDLGKWYRPTHTLKYYIAAIHEI